jgi:hypothetical protein
VPQSHASDFGISTECGFGRRPPETIPELLKLTVHYRRAAPGFLAAFATTGVMRNTAAVCAHASKVRNENSTPQQVFLRCSAISV